MKVRSLSHVQSSATPWTAAHQAPPSMEFSRQEYWSGVPLPSPKYILYFIPFLKALCLSPFLTCLLHNSSLPQFRTFVYLIPFTSGILFLEILLVSFHLILSTFRRVPILLNKFSLMTFSSNFSLLFPNSPSGYILHINDQKLYFKNCFFIFIFSVSHIRL